MTFTNSYVDIWTWGPGDYRIVIKRKPRLAKQLNEILKHYPAGTVFSPEDEALFKFSTAQIELIKQGIKKLGKILTQIEDPS